MQFEFIIDNDTTTNPITIANPIFYFFVNVGKNLHENIKSNIDPLKYITNNVHSINTIDITKVKIILNVVNLVVLLAFPQNTLYLLIVAFMCYYRYYFLPLLCMATCLVCL